MSASHSVQGNEAPYYYVPADSGHPVRMALTLLVIGVSAAAWINGVSLAKWGVLVGFLGLITVMFYWFADSIGEAQQGLYSKRIDVSYRWGMSWFIFSEVMFFAGFFGALWYVRTITTPWLGDLDHKLLLWPDFNAVWPNFGPAGVVEQFQSVGPFWLPTINTALLLTSGITLTIAHHALRENHRGKTTFWLAATVLLGFIFVGVQAYEYHHAYTELNLRFNSGAFGSLFYMLTGFHGFHVIMGAIMLTVMLIRLMKGHFTADNHFGFEAAAWYWHFVDVVWLGLYLFVYWF
ncbi:cytochrome c oxidase subunit 3 [Alcaligenaceae bacterium A4P071]|uniref:cytochrome c oxidase subunit 3 n=1 Tax=Schauerella aestuarii TaxID=2511204 RepID=UPI00136F8993|nr:cytochrome c oxidase subunit 3 [Achromobacter aestuarii]MDQ2136851.1 cytochrome c oxidase subunit 3 [Alcaligenaceae bacterium B3P038]MDQ2149204.1 cytochrome c oxidase subunit 3 [Alcaligenaceae bacterium C4P045]MDQ2186480.1 cytochrome c oxidase subunit 3 [Alcaligenaceae bacterium A4P071]MYZ42230.1 cytochrome c oxidase subunit 3 [Achromobacter aestuarii]